MANLKIDKNSEVILLELDRLYNSVDEVRLQEIIKEISHDQLETLTLSAIARHAKKRPNGISTKGGLVGVLENTINANLDNDVELFEDAIRENPDYLNRLLLEHSIIRFNNFDKRK